MVRKVVIPATISVRTLVVFSLSLKIRSSICFLPRLSRRVCGHCPVQNQPLSFLRSAFVLLSPLGERLGEGVMQEAVFGLAPSPNLSPKGERNMSAWGTTPPHCFRR